MPDATPNCVLYMNSDRYLSNSTATKNIALDGFKEAYSATEVKIGEEVYKSCTIPAVVILKMIAFDDRPDRRIKDIKDINLICKYYPVICISCNMQLVKGVYSPVSRYLIRVCL